MKTTRSKVILGVIFAGLLLFLPAREAFSGGIVQATEVVESEDGSIMLVSSASNITSDAPQTTKTIVVATVDNPNRAQLYIDEGFAYEAVPDKVPEEDIFYIESSTIQEERVQLASPVKSSESLGSNRRHGFLKALTLEARLGSLPDSRTAIVPSNVTTSTNDDVAGYREVFIAETNPPAAMRLHSSIVTASYLMDGSGATLRGPPLPTVGMLP